MIENKKVAALIPVKAYSRRVKNKNMKTLGEHSLLERKILQLKESKYIDTIFVGSDSEAILEVAQSLGATPIMRAARACDENQAAANEMIGDFVARVETDIAVWSHVTNPFVYAEHYDKAIENFNASLDVGDYDSLVSLTKVQSHFWNKHQFPMNFNPRAEKHPFASECDPYFYQNGAIFIQKLEDFRKNSYFYGNNPYPYVLDEIIAYDINTPHEFAVAEQLCNYMDELYSFTIK